MSVLPFPPRPGPATAARRRRLYAALVEECARVAFSERLQLGEAYLHWLRRTSGVPRRRRRAALTRSRS